MSSLTKALRRHWVLVLVLSGLVLAIVVGARSCDLGRVNEPDPVDGQQGG